MVAQAIHSLQIEYGKRSLDTLNRNLNSVTLIGDLHLAGIGYLILDIKFLFNLILLSLAKVAKAYNQTSPERVVR
jgi:hypothetical protein